MRILKRGAILLLAVVSMGVIITRFHAAHAQVQDDGFNIIITPITANVSASPGNAVSTEIRVKNNNAKPEKLKVSLMKFSAYGEEGKPALKEREPGDNYFDWVTFSPQILDAAPGEWKTVKMTINFPAEAAFGYYYAAVFSRANEKPAASGQTALLGSSAVLILAEANVPNAKRSAELISFKTGRSSYEFLPVSFNVRIHNDGNVHVAPQGNIFITKGKSAVGTIKVNDIGGNILPDSNRMYTSDWQDGFPVYKLKDVNGKTLTDENGKQVRGLRWEFGQVAKMRFGHYTAHLLMAYDNGKQDVPIESTISFWVIPWRVIGFGILFIGLSTVGAWTIGKWTGRRIRHNKQNTVKR